MESPPTPSRSHLVPCPHPLLLQVKLTSRDPAPPPFKYVKGGGGIFKDMAIHDLDMSRFLMGEEPQEIFAVGSCHIDKSIEVLEAPESYDTATIIVKYREGRTAMIDVCRQATYGYDQRAEVLGLEAMVMTENLYPTMAKTFTAERVGMADLPYDFFLSRYIEAYKVKKRCDSDSCPTLARLLPLEK